MAFPLRHRRTASVACGDAVASPRWGAGSLVIAGFALLGVGGAALTSAALLLIWMPAAQVARVRLLGPVLLAVAGVGAAVYPPGSTHAVSNAWFVQALCWLSVVFTCALASRALGERHRPSRSRRRSNPYQVTAATAVAATDVETNSTQKWPPKVR
jgi:hypothetical protein